MQRQQIQTPSWLTTSENTHRLQATRHHWLLHGYCNQLEAGVHGNRQCRLYLGGSSNKTVEINEYRRNENVKAYLLRACSDGRVIHYHLLFLAETPSPTGKIYSGGKKKISLKCALIGGCWHDEPGGGLARSYLAFAGWSWDGSSGKSERKLAVIDQVLMDLGYRGYGAAWHYHLGSDIIHLYFQSL